MTEGRLAYWVAVLVLNGYQPLGRYIFAGTVPT